MARITLLVLLGVVCWSTGQQDSLPFSMDNINIDAFLSNKRFVELQIKCVVYNGPCDPVGKYITQSIKKALDGDCPACKDEKLVAIGTKVAEHIHENYPQAWKDGIAKYLQLEPKLAESLFKNTSSS